METRVCSLLKSAIKRLGCVIGLHAYRPCAVEHYWDSSYSSYSYGDNTGVRSTTVTLLCERCLELKAQSLYGAGWIALKSLQPKATEAAVAKPV